MDTCTIFNSWVGILSAKWYLHGKNASKTKLHDFASMCSLSLVHPHYCYNSEIDKIARMLNISLADAGIVMLCIGEPRNQENFNANFDLNAIQKSTGLTSRNYFRTIEPDPSKSYEEMAIVSSGAESLISAELGVHSTVTIPQIVLITETLSTIKQFSLKGETQVNNDGGLNVYVILTYINYFVLLFSLVSSVVQVWISAYARLSHHASARYLSAPKTVRFSDIGSFIISLAIIEPVRMAILLYGEGEGASSYSQIYFISWVVIAFVFLSILFVYNGFLIIGANGIYKGGRRSKFFVNRKKCDKIAEAIGEHRRKEFHDKWIDSLSDELASKVLNKNEVSNGQ